MLAACPRVFLCCPILCPACPMERSQVLQQPHTFGNHQLLRHLLGCLPGCFSLEVTARGPSALAIEGWSTLNPCRKRGAGWPKAAGLWVQEGASLHVPVSRGVQGIPGLALQCQDQALIPQHSTHLGQPSPAGPRI